MKTFLITALVVTLLSFLLSLSLLNSLQDFGNELRDMQELTPDASLATNYLLAGKITLGILFIMFFGWFFSRTQSLKAK